MKYLIFLIYFFSNQVFAETRLEDEITFQVDHAFLKSGGAQIGFQHEQEGNQHIIKVKTFAFINSPIEIFKSKDLLVYDNLKLMFPNANMEETSKNTYIFKIPVFAGIIKVISDVQFSHYTTEDLVGSN
jgi:hypothetical protein